MAASAKAKAPAKQEAASEKRMPDMIARAKQAPDSEYWMNVGAAWTYTNKDGVVCYSVRLNNVPTQWDHSFVLVPPLPPRE